MYVDLPVAGFDNPGLFTSNLRRVTFALSAMSAVCRLNSGSQSGSQTQRLVPTTAVSRRSKLRLFDHLVGEGHKGTSRPSEGPCLGRNG